MADTHQPITRDDLASFFERACTPGATKIGTEQEKFGMVRDGDRLVPVDYTNHIRPMLEQMQSRFGWQAGYDKGINGELVMLERDGASITLEPGGQFELSGAPLATVHETCAEFSQHYEEVNAIATDLGLTFVACGFHPFATLDEINWMPKGRYAVMGSYLPQHGERALDMMTRTCTVQANMDYGSEAECGRRFRTSLAISPLLTAAFANSPLLEGRVNTLQSNRNEVWEKVDPARCGLVPFMFSPEFSFERYVDWALDTPMFFIKRAGGYIEHHGTFRAFLADGLTDDKGGHHRATQADWELHLSTLFPEVRIKPFIEIRGVDTVSSKFVCSLPALLKGLLYDEAACEAAWDLVGHMDFDARVEFWRKGRRLGVRDPQIQQQCIELITLARAALDKMDIRDSKGRTEARFLDSLEVAIHSGKSPGDLALEEAGVTRLADGSAPGFDGRSPAGRDATARAFWFAGLRPGDEPASRES